MLILEPVTMLTDYALAALCLWFAVALRHRSKLWVAAFLVTAIAALLGGTAHGFRVPLGDHWQRVWDLTWWSIAIGSVLLIAAGTRSAIRRDATSDGARQEGLRWLKWAIAVSLVALLMLAAKLSLHQHFNENDIYHVIQMGGLFCLYRGALHLTASTMV